MTRSVTPVPLRNAPCPCGSGKKYKHCCGATAGAAPPSPVATPRSRRSLWYIALGMLAVVAVTIYALVSVNRRPPVAPRPTQGLAPLSSGPTPKAWEFDAANNRHWDPAHGHWHNGPPPPASARP